MDPRRYFSAFANIAQSDKILLQASCRRTGPSLLMQLGNTAGNIDSEKLGNISKL